MKAFQLLSELLHTLEGVSHPAFSVGNRAFAQFPYYRAAGIQGSVDES